MRSGSRGEAVKTRESRAWWWEGARRWLRWSLGLASAGVGLAATYVVLAGLLAARLSRPAPSYLVEDRNGRFLGEVAGEGQEGFGYWPLAELPSRVVAATLALEDRRFGHHPGVDPLAVLRAAWQNFEQGRRVSGASTVAMQVARLQRPGPRTYLRKGVEAVTAVALTARYGSGRILRHYLTIVPYGNRIHGIAYAARRYLAKPVSDLSWAEVAFLTAIPQAPARMNPYDPQGRWGAAERGRQVLDLLLAQGALGREEHQLAIRQIRRLRVPARGRRPEAALHALLAVVERARGAGGGGRIRSTLDLELQEEAAWQLRRAVERWRSGGVGNGAVLVVDKSRGRVLAWVGSSGYFDEARAGAIDYVRVSRSPGSALKPFLYALALERGVITPATVLDDLGRGAGGITNADQRFLGPLLPRFALANSRNVPAVELLAHLGLDVGYRFFGDLGLHHGARDPAEYGLGLALGGLPVTLEELVRAYTALAGDGRVLPLRLLPGAGGERRMLREATARLITLFLADPEARLPSFPRMGWSEYPFPVAVKTGTSSRYRDAWTVAWSQRYLVGVWLGHPDQRPMRGVSGYRAASRLVHELLVHLHPDQLQGLEDVGFPPPRGYRPVRLCALTGLLATPACDRVTLEWFPAGSEPMARCRAHRLLAVDRRDGLLATSATPRGELSVRSFVDLGPRYAAWAQATGLPTPPSRTSTLGPDGISPRPAPPRRRRPVAGSPARITISSPPNGAHLLLDPETPGGLATVALEAVVEPAVEQAVWYVDGTPFQVVDQPYGTRWSMTPGDHTFQLRLPFRPERSAVVRVRVE